jgi:hypothetical protein
MARLTLSTEEEQPGAIEVLDCEGDKIVVGNEMRERGSAAPAGGIGLCNYFVRH